MNNKKYTYVRLCRTKEPVCLLNIEFEKSKDEYLFWAIDEFCDPYACEFALITLESPVSFGWHGHSEIDDNGTIEFENISLTDNSGWMIIEKVKEIKTWHQFSEDRGYSIIESGDNNDTNNN